MLKSGDVIEVGAQTRLKFVLKEPEAAEVGPVVRRRPRKARDEVEEVEEAPKAPDVVSTISDSFRKRRGLVIGLGLYFVLILAAILLIKPPWGKKDSGVAPPPRWDEQRIKLCLEFRLGLPLDMTMANRKLDEAYRYYQQRISGDPMSYYNAIRCFTASIEYRGGSMLPYKDQQVFDTAKAELVKQLWNLYQDALLAEDRGDKKKARECYDKIMQRVPAGNDLYRHVDARRNRLR